jgi:hypothetical protein
MSSNTCLTSNKNSHQVLQPSHQARLHLVIISVGSSSTPLLLHSITSPLPLLSTSNVTSQSALGHELPTQTTIISFRQHLIHERPTYPDTVLSTPPPPTQYTLWNCTSIHQSFGSLPPTLNPALPSLLFQSYLTPTSLHLPTHPCDNHSVFHHSMSVLPPIPTLILISLINPILIPFPRSPILVPHLVPIL